MKTIQLDWKAVTMCCLLHEHCCVVDGFSAAIHMESLVGVTVPAVSTHCTVYVCIPVAVHADGHVPTGVDFQEKEGKVRLNTSFCGDKSNHTHAHDWCCTPVSSL